jgi:hypothetical protein
MFPKSGMAHRIEQIQRDYPYQVVLNVMPDEEALITWLDRRIGRWDMYVDLRETAPVVRYCFYDVRDASAFSLRFVAGCPTANVKIAS